MVYDSTSPPSLRLQHLWPISDRVEQQRRLTQEVLTECERVAQILGLRTSDLTEEALHLLVHPELAPDFTPEQVELEREVMYREARVRCSRIGKNFDDVKPEIDALVDSIITAVSTS